MPAMRVTIRQTPALLLRRPRGGLRVSTAGAPLHVPADPGGARQCRRPPCHRQVRGRRLRLSSHAERRRGAARDSADARRDAAVVRHRRHRPRRARAPRRRPEPAHRRVMGHRRPRPSLRGDHLAEVTDARRPFHDEHPDCRACRRSGARSGRARDGFARSRSARAGTNPIGLPPRSPACGSGRPARRRAQRLRILLPP